MKKAIVAFAILLVVSLAGTVGFGLAVGKEALREFIGSDAFNNINWSVWNDNDWEENTTDRLYSDQSKTFTVAENQNVMVDIPFGTVKITVSPNDTCMAQLRLYTRSGVERSVSLIADTQPDGSIKIGSHFDDAISGTASIRAEWDIALPAQKISALDFRVNAGKVSVENLDIGSLKVQINAGDASLSGVQTDTMDLTVNAGRLLLEHDTTAQESIEASVAAGELGINWPDNQGFTLKSQVSAGNFECRGFGGNFQSSDNSKIAGFRSREFSYGDGSCKISIRVSAGSAWMTAAQVGMYQLESETAA